MSEPLQLTEDEARSAVWLKISAHLNTKLQGYRVKNDGSHAWDDTTRLRGRIAEIKELLALDPSGTSEQ